MRASRKSGLILICQIAIFAIIAGLWELVGRLSDSIFFVIGTPSSVFDELIVLVVNDGLLRHMAVTGSEAFVGLFIGTSFGSLAGLSGLFSSAGMRGALSQYESER
jgi:ABC-type nitrate/sulfonate/bicarbonate transport system permease component